MRNPNVDKNFLRIAVEAQLAKNLASPLSPADVLLHELQVHQIELEMQNEELRRVQLELVASRDRYIDIYDFAPMGYLTLTPTGRISEINLTCASLLGESRNKLVQANFSRYVAAGNSDYWYKFFRSALEQKEQQSCQLTMQRADGRCFQANLVCVCSVFEVPVLRISMTDVSVLSEAEEALRIAAVAFECQEGIVVMNADLKVLRVNLAFAQMTGYLPSEVQGRTTAFLRSHQHPVSFYEAIWRDTQSRGNWQGEMWHQRKNGSDYMAWVTITGVRNMSNQVTHYVANITDATYRRQQEQQRLSNEAEHRHTLVHEVHHRIKNNLQGVIGLLRQFANKNPETAEALNEAISQVQGISVIYGLQGRAVTSSVRLCELTEAIAAELEKLWQTPIILTRAPNWMPCIIALQEAVPIALILNELILNAVKHGGKENGQIDIDLESFKQIDRVLIKIKNVGKLEMHSQPIKCCSGLNLISALMPRLGANLVKTQQGEQVIAVLALESPVINFTLEDAQCS